MGSAGDPVVLGVKFCAELGVCVVLVELAVFVKLRLNFHSFGFKDVFLFDLHLAFLVDERDRGVPGLRKDRVTP